ncbi:phage terminase, large subunit [Staphylococcus phage SaGU1]|uniref:Phage terminase, large subunit n=1 Tax=Staphylococcus phage SaGU1 TaxID=2758660 RepID=A0A8S0G5N5_9CAUD|nr:phage terminase, large subunit [Staphylococcus phage SaGU1]
MTVVTTNEQMKKFVQSRLNPVLEKEYFRDIVDWDKDSLGFKKIRNSSLFFRTSSKASTVEGVDIDYLSLDEYDRVNLLAESSALESMSSSPFKIVRRWSTPSVPGMGIHKLYQQSDQWYYGHRCQHCDYLNEMSYNDYNPDNLEESGNMLCVNPEGVDEQAKTVQNGSYQFVCQKCGKPLDRWYNGEWHCKYPERTKGNKGVRGYLITQMNAVWISADELKEKEMNTESKQAFYNYILGYPFEDVKLRVNEEDVYGNKSPIAETQLMKRDRYSHIAIGIDWGNTHWITVHGMLPNGKVDLIRLFSVKKMTRPDLVEADLEKIIWEISKYDPDIIIADNGDSGNNVLKLINHFGKDKVFGCTYKSSPKSTGQLRPEFNENNNRVTVDKLMQNKRYIQALKTKDISVYSTVDDDLKTFLKHWQNVVIMDEEDEKTGEMYQVIKRKGDDHYAQASVYAYIGLTRIKELLKEGNGTSFGSTFVSTDYNQEGNKQFYFDE